MGKCAFRAKKYTIKIGFFTQRTFISCRRCESWEHLLTSVKQVTGVIGGFDKNLRQNDATVRVPLWSEGNQTVRNADIDVLHIRSGKVENYDLTVNKVINALKNDVSRPADWCKQIPVLIEGSAILSPGAMRMLRDTECVPLV